MRSEIEITKQSTDSLVTPPKIPTIDKKILGRMLPSLFLEMVDIMHSTQILVQENRRKSEKPKVLEVDNRIKTRELAFRIGEVNNEGKKFQAFAKLAAADPNCFLADLKDLSLCLREIKSTSEANCLAIALAKVLDQPHFVFLIKEFFAEYIRNLSDPALFMRNSEELLPTIINALVRELIHLDPALQSYFNKNAKRFFDKIALLVLNDFLQEYSAVKNSYIPALKTLQKIKDAANDYLIQLTKPSENFPLSLRQILAVIAENLSAPKIFFNEILLTDWYEYLREIDPNSFPSKATSEQIKEKLTWYLTVLYNFDYYTLTEKYPQALRKKIHGIVEALQKKYFKEKNIESVIKAMLKIVVIKREQSIELTGGYFNLQVLGSFFQDNIDKLIENDPNESTEIAIKNFKDKALRVQTNFNELITDMGSALADLPRLQHFTANWNKVIVDANVFALLQEQILYFISNTLQRPLQFITNHLSNLLTEKSTPATFSESHDWQKKYIQEINCSTKNQVNALKIFYEIITIKPSLSINATGNEEKFPQAPHASLTADVKKDSEMILKTMETLKDHFFQRIIELLKQKDNVSDKEIIQSAIYFIQTAIAEDNANKVEFLYKLTRQNILFESLTTSIDFTFTCLAAERNALKSLEKLHNLGENIDLPSGNVTPLFVAASRNFNSMAHLLVKLGAKVDSLNTNQWTPLMIASYNNDKTMVNTLLTSANNTLTSSKISDEQRLAALKIAQMCGHQHITGLLSHYPSVAPSTTYFLNTLQRSRSNSMPSSTKTPLPTPIFTPRTSVETPSPVPKRRVSEMEIKETKSSLHSESETKFEP